MRACRQGRSPAVVMSPPRPRSSASASRHGLVDDRARQAQLERCAAHRAAPACHCQALGATAGARTPISSMSSSVRKARAANSGLGLGIVAARLRAAAFLAQQRAGGDEAGGERHVGEHAVAARLPLDVAQHGNRLLEACRIAHDADVLAHRPRAGARRPDRAWRCGRRCCRRRAAARRARGVPGSRSSVRMSCAARAANTTASSSELEASRLAPCRPVEATSPTAHRPGTLERPRASVAMPPMW